MASSEWRPANMEKAGMAMPANLSFDVTDNVRALKAKGEWQEREANVSFFARGLIPPPSEEDSVAEARAASDTAEPAGSPRMERVVFRVE